MIGKTIKVISVLAIFFLASCQKTVNDDALTVRLSIQDQSVKTSLGGFSGGQYPVLWSEGDVVVLNGVSSSALSSDEASSATATFRFKGNITAPYNFLYCGVSGKDNEVSFSGAQTLAVGNIPSCSLPMYAASLNLNSITMNHLGAVLKFAFTGTETISQIKISSLGGESLAGNFSMSKDASGLLDVATFAPSGSNTSTVMLDGNAVLSGTPTEFLVVVPAGTYSSGFYGQVIASDGKIMEVYFNTKDHKTLSRAVLYNFGQSVFVPTGKVALAVSSTENFSKDTVSYE
jgi:hypothetical protein